MWSNAFVYDVFCSGCLHICEQVGWLRDAWPQYHILIWDLQAKKQRVPELPTFGILCDGIDQFTILRDCKNRCLGHYLRSLVNFDADSAVCRGHQLIHCDERALAWCIILHAECLDFPLSVHLVAYAFPFTHRHVGIECSVKYRSHVTWTRYRRPFDWNAHYNCQFALPTQCRRIV